MITELLLRQLKQDGCYIQFIQEATEEMQLIAVQQNYLALQYIENPSDIVIDVAIQRDGYTLGLISVTQRTAQRCLLAVQTQGLALQFVPHQTEQICMQPFNKMVLLYSMCKCLCKVFILQRLFKMD